MNATNHIMVLPSDELYKLQSRIAANVKSYLRWKPNHWIAHFPNQNSLELVIRIISHHDKMQNLTQQITS